MQNKTSNTLLYWSCFLHALYNSLVASFLVSGAICSPYRSTNALTHVGSLLLYSRKLHPIPLLIKKSLLPRLLQMMVSNNF